jgi:hypothetical protein
MPARFAHQNDNWKNDAWSLIITTLGETDDRGYQSATARFLMPKAPDEWLSVGEKFTLSDGTADLAEGIVESVGAEM